MTTVKMPLWSQSNVTQHKSVGRLLPYCAIFSRRIIFADFADLLCRRKLSSRNFSCKCILRPVPRHEAFPCNSLGTKLLLRRLKINASTDTMLPRTIASMQNLSTLAIPRSPADKCAMCLNHIWSSSVLTIDQFGARCSANLCNEVMIGHG